MKTVSPFSRYVGGKTRLLPHIMQFLPSPGKVNRYFEPFCGSGALYFTYGHLCKEAYLNDICRPLMVTYSELAYGRFDKIEDQLCSLMEDDYEEIRKEFNSLHLDPNVGEQGLNARYAALFIALNHLCFNGVWRENKKGEFNVPLGKTGAGPKAKPRVLTSMDFDKFESTAKLLKNCTLITSDSFDPWPFDVSPQEGDIAFYDSPYLNEFSAYSKNGFNLDCHKTLAAQAKSFADAGAIVIVCGSNNLQSREVYKDASSVYVVSLARTVGNRDRKKAEETLYIYTK